MKHRTFAISAILILVASLVTIAGDTPSKSDLSGRISTEISVFPTDEPDVWMGEAIVTDINTGEILTQPQVRFKAGEEAKLRSGGMLGPDAKDEFYVLLEVYVGETGESAKYTSTVSIGGEIVSKQSASFKLK